ncbi:uncharacterized protein MONOS_18673 [Monocercomonoides exilis]|uniref:uncharacterized protein n=1 Tax=Monocercomonoides exilis TaxID=2049356 RepID=UPI003559707B|nr:hypothetical protein MONOS_18673 [Monocercomonoides exilis]
MIASKKLEKCSSSKMFMNILLQIGKTPLIERKAKVEEMITLIIKMNGNELCSILDSDILNRINLMIETKNLSLENAISLIKQIGYCKVMKDIYNSSFCFSSLSEKFESLILMELKKKEERREKLLIDLCECCFMLFENEIKMRDELIPVCASCLMKVALCNDKSEGKQKETEIDLLALSCFPNNIKVNKIMYINEVKKIIHYHQEHHNLTQLAYQSAWQFLINRFFFESSLEYVIANELHFAREAVQELAELSKCVELKKNEKGEEEKKVTHVIMRWLNVLNVFFSLRTSNGKSDCVEVISCLVCTCRRMKKHKKTTADKCIHLFKSIMYKKRICIEDILSGGVISFFFEDVRGSTVNNDDTISCLEFFQFLTSWLKEFKQSENEEMQRKMLKRKAFSKLEEEGYEDIILGYTYVFRIICRFSRSVNDFFIFF